jgi:sugar phosphate isomerase/epimerase
MEKTPFSLHVNLRFSSTREEDLDFLAVQNLHPELYFSGEDADELSGEKLARLVTTLQAKKLSPILHAPFYDLNFGAFDAKIRAVAQERLLWALQASKTLGSPQIVVHPGYGPYVFSKNFPGWLERAKPVLGNIVAKAKELGIKLAFENIYDTTPEDLRNLVTLFPEETVGVCFDIGHFNLFSEVPLRNWLEELGPRILELHLHDNSGENDDHIAVGDGSVKFAPLLRWYHAVEKKPIRTLEMEQRTHVIKSVQRLKEWFAPEPVLE